MTTKKDGKARAAVAQLIGTWMHESALALWAANPRDNEGAVPKIAESLKRYGFVAPVVVWPSKNMLVAGNTRLKALRSILAVDPSFVPPGAPAPGMVPVREHEFPNEAEAMAYAIADNRLASEADWDYEKLVPMLEDLGKVDVSLLAATGFRPDELDSLTRSVFAQAEEALPGLDDDEIEANKADRTDRAPGKGRKIEVSPQTWKLFVDVLERKLGITVENEEEAAEALTVMLRRFGS